ncbi:MAG: acylphosphatase [Conexivisphaerales archaeon]
MNKAFEIIARGRLQRVGYRRFVLGLAQEIGLSGYVKNLSD